jgi:hypothetical protein
VNERDRRIGQNEALFREVNERVERLAETFQATEAPMALLCECGNENCFEQIELTVDEYEALRADPSLFAVRPGHDAREAEDVVEEHDPRYWVVRKHPGQPQALAEELDPRSD